MRPLVATGQQMGVGWTPALSVIKALSALAAAQALQGEAVYWLADEDHDRLEVASTVGFQGHRLVRHRFSFDAPPPTATGWLPWTKDHQAQAQTLWGPLPEPCEATLRGHVLVLGTSLWTRGLRPFSPTSEVQARWELQPVLEAWRRLELEEVLCAQAARLEAEGAPLPLDPRLQAAWFSLDPRTGIRRRLDPHDACPQGCWLSPGAALRPLLQSRLLPVTHVVLGPAERAYWRLTEPLWERVELKPPVMLPRPTVHVIPFGISLKLDELEPLQQGHWKTWVPADAPALPSTGAPDPAWSPALAHRYRQAWQRFQRQLRQLDRRFLRDQASARLGMDAERLRQWVFPLGRFQERVWPGWWWLKDGPLLDSLAECLSHPQPVHLIVAPEPVP